MALVYLEEYSYFNSVEEMDKQIKERIDRDRFNLTKSERAIVFAIKGHCLVPAGACHLKNKTIADEVGVSLITVSRAISNLVKIGIIGKVNRSKMNGIKGANIYYFIPQQNDVSSVMYRENVEESSNIADSSEVFEGGSINSFNLLQTSSLQEIYNNAHAEEEAAKEYMNDWQVMLYDFLSDLPLVQAVRDDLGKLVLASEINSVQAFHKAKNVIINLSKDIADGTLQITKSIRAIFAGAYNKRRERSDRLPSTISSVEEKQHTEPPVQFYDWLSEREDSCPEFIVPEQNMLENWLEW